MIICAHMASAETKHEDIDAEPDTIAKELLQIIQRDINCLADGNRAVKKRALEKIKKETLDKGTLTSEVFHIVFREVHKPLLKLFGDQADKCRELSIKLVLGFCHKLNTPWTFLPYIIPTLVQRLGNKEIVEPTEEIRLLHIESLRSLVDICKEHLNLYIEDLIRILERTLVDPFADVKKASCLCTDKVAVTLSEKFYLHGESLIPPLLQSISHQHNKVRVSCLQTIGIVIKATSGKAVDDVVSHLAQRTFDHSPPVRLAVTTVVGDWLLNLRDRYSFFHKLIPLLLTGFSDEMPDIRQKSKDYFDQIGGQYENENEDDFKERKDFHTSKHFEPYLGHQRPHLGCRALVQRNFSKILPALLRDITDWTVETRIKAAHLLYHLVYFAEDHVTMHMEPLLNGLYKSAQDEESQVVQQQFRAVFQNPYFIDTCATVYDNDRFDSFPLMADKIRVRSADKGFVVQSSDEAMKRCLYGDLCSLGFH